MERLWVFLNGDVPVILILFWMNALFLVVFESDSVPPMAGLVGSFSVFQTYHWADSRS